MVDANLPNESSFSRFLPGIYQARALSEKPLNALLGIFEGFVSQIEQGIEDAPTQFDPNTARPEFLDWLASWVALPLDDEWEGENQRARKSYLITNAAELYRLRGTTASLRYMLRAFHGLDTEILEWTWPACMQIGINSTMGKDCTIMDQPDLRHCFVAVLRLSEAQKAKLADFVDLIPLILVQHENACVATPVLKPKQKLGQAIIRKLEKISELINNEKPANTRCYVAIEEPRSGRMKARIESMVIEVKSDIDFCRIG